VQKHIITLMNLKFFTIRPILGKNSKKEFQIILNFSQIKAVFSAAKNSL